MQNSRKERTRRVILIRMMLDISGQIDQRGASPEETLVSMAVRLGSYEGKPMDVTSISGVTNLPRSSAIRHLAALRHAGEIKTEHVGRRSVQFLSLTVEAQRDADFYGNVQRIVEKTCARLTKVEGANVDQSKVDTLTIALRNEHQ